MARSFESGMDGVRVGQGVMPILGPAPQSHLLCLIAGGPATVRARAAIAVAARPPKAGP